MECIGFRCMYDMSMPCIGFKCLNWVARALNLHRRLNSIIQMIHWDRLIADCRLPRLRIIVSMPMPMSMCVCLCVHEWKRKKNIHFIWLSCLLLLLFLFGRPFLQALYKFPTTKFFVLAVVMFAFGQSFFPLVCLYSAFIFLCICFIHELYQRAKRESERER